MRAMDCKLKLLVLIYFTSCGKVPNGAIEQGTSQSADAKVGVAQEAVNPPGPLVTDPVGPAAWSRVANTSPWTNAVVAVVTAQLSKFEAARDKESYCPGYASATLGQRKTCWLRIISAVAKFESGFNPNTLYKESNGVFSVGLLQLSSGECPNAPTVEKLKDPVQNLICGTNKMAALIARYGYITSPDNTHGAAAYWSTLRAPYTSGGLHLGKRSEVIKLAAIFRTPASVMLAEQE